MASLVSSVSMDCFLFFLFILCFSNKESHALTTTKGDKKQSIQHHTVVHVSSFFPASACRSSTQGESNGASPKVVHRHGPCSHLTLDKSKVPTTTELLTQDQSRVNSIQSRFSFNSGQSTLKASQVKLPAKSGSGGYIIVVGLGTPKKQLSLVFDTGSDLTWTQCKPCVKCYKQKDPIFDPSLSTTYRNVSCKATQCSHLTSITTGAKPVCSSSTCVYKYGYGDNSTTTGFLGTDTLTLTPRDVFPNYFFGCGNKNQGLFSGIDGLLGLGRDNISVVSQTASKHGKYFSYCLPSLSSTGYLTFGKGGNSKSLKFTPLVSTSDSVYFIDIMAIKCGPTLLSIPRAIFKTAGTIIDSGTVITRLPPTAYSALKTEFRKQMAKYPSAPAISLFDTCYNLTDYPDVTIPKVTFYFGGNVRVPITDMGNVYNAGGISQICLAYAANSHDSDQVIFGNVQQQTMKIVYDVAGGKVGFGRKGCS